VRRLTPLHADELVELGRGTESVAYLIDGEWVARFPAVPAAQATLRRELALLPELGRALPLVTPAFEHVGRSGTELVFVAYRSISGIPLTPDTFVRPRTGRAGSRTGFAGRVPASAARLPGGARAAGGSPRGAR
jgi:hypothetical protein